MGHNKRRRERERERDRALGGLGNGRGRRGRGLGGLGAPEIDGVVYGGSLNNLYGSGYGYGYGYDDGYDNYGGSGGCGCGGWVNPRLGYGFGGNRECGLRYGDTYGNDGDYYDDYGYY
jgi:hypothetical protein